MKNTKANFVNAKRLLEDTYNIKTVVTGSNSNDCDKLLTVHLNVNGSQSLINEISGKIDKDTLYMSSVNGLKFEQPVPLENHSTKMLIKSYRGSFYDFLRGDKFQDSNVCAVFNTTATAPGAGDHNGEKWCALLLH